MRLKALHLTRSARLPSRDIMSSQAAFGVTSVARQFWDCRAGGTMCRIDQGRCIGVLLMVVLSGFQRDATTRVLRASDQSPPAQADPFLGSNGGDQRQVRP